MKKKKRTCIVGCVKQKFQKKVLSGLEQVINEISNNETTAPKEKKIIIIKEGVIKTASFSTTT